MSFPISQPPASTVEVNHPTATQAKPIVETGAEPVAANNNHDEVSNSDKSVHANEAKTVDFPEKAESAPPSHPLLRAADEAIAAAEGVGKRINAQVGRLMDAKERVSDMEVAKAEMAAAGPAQKCIDAMNAISEALQDPNLDDATRSALNEKMGALQGIAQFLSAAVTNIRDVVDDNHKQFAKKGS